MNINTYPDGIAFEKTNNFDLSDTLECGQCFRWEKLDGKYHGIAQKKVSNVFEKDEKIIFQGNNIQDFMEFWHNYFDLETNYGEIGESLACSHPVLKKAYHFCSGIRILKQEPWETLCSFIISQNNNIPRIKKIISSLCALLGDKIGNDFSFPTASRICALGTEDLAPIKAGFRAEYLLDAARKVSLGEINFSEIKKVDLFEAQASLMKIKGVGPKVAQCVLLYGFHRLEAFPEDIWIKKIMGTLFKNESPKIFGHFAGVAQQYLYHYARMNPQILE